MEHIFSNSFQRLFARKARECLPNLCRALRGFRLPPSGGTGRLKLPLLAAAFFSLFALMPQKAQADGGNNGTGIEYRSSGYDKDRGFYVEFRILFYEDDNLDEWMHNGILKLEDKDGNYKQVFKITTSEKDQPDGTKSGFVGSGSGLKSVTNKQNGYQCYVLYYSSCYTVADPEENSGASEIPNTVGDGYLWANDVNAKAYFKVKIYLPQTFIPTSGTRKWTFTSEAYENANCCSVKQVANYSNSGTYRFDGTPSGLPSITNTAPTLDKTNGYYSFDYSLSSYIRDATGEVSCRYYETIITPVRTVVGSHQEDISEEEMRQAWDEFQNLISNLYQNVGAKYTKKPFPGYQQAINSLVANGFSTTKTVIDYAWVDETTTNLLDEYYQTYTHTGSSDLKKTVSHSTVTRTTSDRDYMLDSKNDDRTVDLTVKWKHSTSGIQYSVEKTGIEIKHIRYPEAVSAIDNKDGTIGVTWTTDKKPSSVSNDGWLLQYKIGSAGTWTNAPMGTSMPSIDNSTNEFSTTFTIPNEELGKGTQTYYFRVSRTAVNAGVNSKETSTKINTDLKTLVDYQITVGPTGYPRLTWGQSTSGIGASTRGLKLRIAGIETDISDSLAGGSFQMDSVSGTTGYIYGLGVADCVKQRYVLIYTNGTKTTEYIVSDNFSFKPLGKRRFESLTVSKGYYPDRINVKWALPDGYDDFSRFRIMRRILGAGDDDWVLIGSDFAHNHGTLSYSYDDMEINAGVYYQYKVTGIFSCDGTESVMESTSSVGFSQPFGSVSGRITYSGSSSVEGVSVKLTTESNLQNNRDLEFIGGLNGGGVTIPAKVLNPDAFTFQVWLYNVHGGSMSAMLDFGSAEKSITLLDNNSVVVGLDSLDRPFAMLGYGEWVRSDTASVGLNAYRHLTVTAEKVSNGGYDEYLVNIYIDGELKQSGTTPIELPLNNDEAVRVGSDHTGYHSFYGRMDDVRFWTRALTPAEVAENYDRTLSGKDDGLIAYYRFDEPDELNDELFDCSSTGTQFHGNHAVKGYMVNRHDVPGEANHLGLKGTTDRNGIYGITNAVPYTSEGTTYTITPMFGIHEFDPDQRPLFFNPDSKVFNNVDFTDVSSFKVSGYVYYANSDYPVDSVMIYIDGMPANKDGQAIMTGTGENKINPGRFTVDVPIGSHYITLIKNGHTFANGGRFPADPDGVGLKYNFQTGFEFQEPFYDNTTVRLMGRVVGGQIQTDKPLGLGLSKANIGKATITLRTTATKQLNLHDSDSTNIEYLGDTVKYASKTTFMRKNANVYTVVEIETNPETGEFIATLPPVEFQVVGASTHDYQDLGISSTYEFAYSTMKPRLNPLLNYDLKNSKGKLLATYNDTLLITRYNEPSISVTDLDAKPGAFGDSVYVYTNPVTGAPDSITLYTVDGNGNVKYTLGISAEHPDGVPALRQGMNTYRWQVQAYQVYFNRDSIPVIDYVPLAYNTVEIRNGLASMRVDIDSVTQGATLSNESNTSMILDSTGVRTYSFQTGFPNIAGDYTLSCGLTVRIDGKAYLWQQSGILLGQVPVPGSNFVTVGPDDVDIVLHDPPGSNSYAYIEKGSSYTITKSRHDVNTQTTTEEVTISYGPEINTSTGWGFEVENSSSTIFNVELHAEEEHVWDNTWEDTRTTTFTANVQTSGDPNYIGSMADVYIGASSNIIYGKMRQLGLYPKAERPAGTPGIDIGDYSLFVKEIVAADQKFGTMFNFTQTHILETQIPNTKALRNSLITILKPEDKMPANAKEVLFKRNDQDVNVMYFTRLAASDENFGNPQTYYTFYKEGIPESLKVDEVRAYNTYILNWQGRIEDNEAAKIELFNQRSTLDAMKDAKIFENVSYDAGATLEKSLEVEYEKVETYTHTFSGEGSLGGNTGYHFNNIGIAAHGVLNARRDQTNEEGETNGSTMKFGYVLAEDESVLFAGKDALTVDVYGPSSDDMMLAVRGNTIPHLSGFTFQLRAGQTSCPYEGADSTLFYKENGNPVQLNYGTFKIENAKLYVGAPGEGNNTWASVENVPAGRDATLTLRLQNLSEANMDVTYLLAVDPATNPDGLIIEMDGEPLVAGRQIRINFQQELTKTLKLRQSNIDILDYDSIEVRLGSVCDVFDYSPAYISAHFAPSSSPVTLSVASALANRYSMTNSGSKLVFTISDYDRNFKNFAYIRLQYRKTTEEGWSTPIEFVNNETLYPINSSDKVKIDGATMKYEFDYTELTPSDGDYIFRAVAVSKFGSDDIVSESNEILITKDILLPQVLGNPSPTNGILNPGDEISITFNEDIQTGPISSTNFSITGILNADERVEPTSGLFFDGVSNVAYTELPVYANGSFTIEGWIQMPELRAGTLFAYGEPGNYLTLGFDAAGHAVVSIGGESYTSSIALQASEVWKYIGMSYNSADRSVSVYALEETSNLAMINGYGLTQTPSAQGKFYVGNNAARTSGFRGAVSFLHFYNTGRGLVDAVVSKYQTKSGSEPGLIGLWELDEGEGTVAKDKARSRNLALAADWYIYPTGRSLSFNGGECDSLNSRLFPLLRNDDFTYEFWFKGGSQNEATMFSAWNIIYVGFNAAHELILTVDGTTQKLADAGLLDDNWHHFALSVKRSGNTNAYVDGVKTATFNSSIFNDILISGANYYLGAKMMRVGAPLTNVYSQYFKGNIDEVRIWESALSTEAILLEKNHKLRGTEAGLLAYYPFENYTLNMVWSVEPTLKDMVPKDVTLSEPNTVGNINIGAATSLSDIAAPLSDARPVKNVPFTFTASERKIVLNITEEAYRTEGVTLTITAEGIFDMHNNPSNAYTWIAYVNQKPLQWQTDAIAMKMEEGTAQSFKASILNRSGASKVYYIESVPSWLTLDAPTGTLQPLQVKDLTFTVSSGINPGYYDESIVLIGDDNVRSVLPVQLKVTGIRPDWTVNPADFSSSMTVTGQLTVGNIVQEDEDDIFAAFIGDTCVGMITPRYVPEYNAYFSFLTVYGKDEYIGENITFKLWDAGTGNIYSVVESKLNNVPTTVVFSSNGMTGNPITPVIHNALSNVIEQRIALESGWNWISVNVENNSPAILQQFKDNIGVAGELLKGQDGYIQSPLWTGTLSNIERDKMYIAKTNSPVRLSFGGTTVSPASAPISLESGWNWIGYIPQSTLSTKSALAGLNARTGDQIKGQSGYRTYTGANGWIGNLDYLRAGEGYMYYSTDGTAKTFVYPGVSQMQGAPVAASSTSNDVFTRASRLTLNTGRATAKVGKTVLQARYAPEATRYVAAANAATPLAQSSPLAGADLVAASGSHWTPIINPYCCSMTLTGYVQFNGVEVASEEIEVAAFIGDVCRGTVNLQKTGDRYLCFLSVWGNAEDNGSDVTIKVYDHRDNTEYTANEQPVFITDRILGYPDYYRITVGSATALTDAAVPVITVQPNDRAVAFGEAVILSLSATVSDGGTLSYQWYSNVNKTAVGGTAITGATDSTYAAPTNVAGTAFYYAVVTNTNNSVSGNKTALATTVAVSVTVSDAVSATLSGVATISNTAPRIGDVLTGSLVNGNNTGTLTYTWTVDGVEVGTGATYSVKASDFGKTIILIVVSDVESGAVTSAATDAVRKKTAPAAPAVPTLESKTYNSVTLKSNTAYEFSLDGSNWQTSNVFPGLASSTAYTFYQRIAETADTEASEASAALNVTTAAAQADALNGTAVISNTVPRIYDVLTGSFINGNNNGELTYTWKVDGVEVGTGATYSVKAADLGKTVTLVVTSNIESGAVTSAATAPVRKKASPAAPAVPTLESKTYSSVTLKANAAYEFSIDSINWQTSNVFYGLTADTEYKFYQRIAETADTEVSAVSEALRVRTNSSQSGILSGVATVSNTAPRIGDVLTGSLADGNNTGELFYTWKVDGVESGTGTTYSVKAADLGKTIILTVISDVESGAVTSAATDAVRKKAAPAAPAVPILESKTYNSVTLKANATYEFSLDGSNWQTSNVFPGLTANTAYKFYQRIAETADTEASEVSAALNVTTAIAQDGALNGIAAISNTAPRIYDVLTGTFTDSNNTGELTYTWKVDGVESGTGTTYSVKAADLGKTITLIVTSDVESGAVTSAATDAVRKKLAQTPDAPILAAKTYTGVTLKAVEGFEYSQDGVNWQLSNVFDKLTSNTAYTFYQRRAETDDTEASAASAALNVTTNAAPIAPAISTESLPDGVIDAEYSATLAATGDAAIVWMVTEGSLPAGLTLTTGGIITGTPTVTGTFRFTVTAGNEAGSDTRTLTLKVNEPPRVTSVAVSPKTVNVQTGTTQPFNAVVKVVNDAPQTVEWTVEGGVAGTAISADGLLIVAESETADTLKVITVSTFDNTVRDTAIVAVTTLPVEPQVLRIAVVPDSVSLEKGATQQFTAIVDIEGGALQDIVWMLEGGADSTYVSEDGILTVAVDETAETLVLIAQSVHDGETAGEAVIYVLAEEPDVPAELISLTINSSTVAVDEVIEYKADCSETEITLSPEISSKAVLSVNGKEYSGEAIPLNGDTQATLTVRGANGDVQTYTLKIYAPYNDDKLYYSRWDDVLAVNLNQQYNNNNSIVGVRWYRRGSNEIISNAGYVHITGDRMSSSAAHDYYAEVLLAGTTEWRRVCGEPVLRSVAKVVAYPNPVRLGTSLTLRLPETFVGGNAKIYTLNGRLVKSGIPLPDLRFSLDMSQYGTGIYLLNLTAKTGETDVVKIIVE